MPLARFKCLKCEDEWDSTVYRKHRYCPGCGNTETIIEVPSLVRRTTTSTKVVYDGGGERAASPVEMPRLGSLVFIRRTSASDSDTAPYWDLVAVTGAVDLQSEQRAFCTLCHGNFLLSDVGKSWNPPPPEYMTFLAALGLPFENFAMELARGGIEGITGKVSAALNDWGEHNAARYRGVAQVALSLFTEFLVDFERRQKQPHTARTQQTTPEVLEDHVSQEEYAAQVRANVELRDRISFAQQVLGGLDVRKA